MRLGHPMAGRYGSPRGAQGGGRALAAMLARAQRGEGACAGPHRAERGLQPGCLTELNAPTTPSAHSCLLAPSQTEKLVQGLLQRPWWGHSRASSARTTQEQKPSWVPPQLSLLVCLVFVRRGQSRALWCPDGAPARRAAGQAGGVDGEQRSGGAAGLPRIPPVSPSSPLSAPSGLLIMDEMEALKQKLTRV